MQIERNLKKIKEKNSLVLNVTSNLNQTLIDGYRARLFAKIKDSLDKKKQSVQKEQIEFKEWLKDLKPFNNSSYLPYIGA